MQKILSETRVVFSVEVRRQIRRKQYLIITFTPVVILLVLALAVPLVRGFLADDGESADRADSGRTIAVVNESAELNFADSDSDSFQVLADRAAGMSGLAGWGCRRPLHHSRRLPADRPHRVAAHR